MKKLKLSPERSSYLPTWDANGLMTEDSGAIAPLFVGGPGSAGANVNLAWVCDEQEYAYLQAFMRIHGHGAKPFLLDLILEGVEPTEYVVSLVGGSLTLSLVQGPLRTMSARILAVRNDRRAWREFNENAFLLVGAGDPALAYSFDALAQLANETLPEEL